MGARGRVAGQKVWLAEHGRTAIGFVVFGYGVSLTGD